jgi:hypothetical protein
MQITKETLSIEETYIYLGITLDAHLAWDPLLHGIRKRYKMYIMSLSVISNRGLSIGYCVRMFHAFISAPPCIRKYQKGPAFAAHNQQSCNRSTSVVALYQTRNGSNKNSFIFIERLNLQHFSKYFTNAIWKVIQNH